MNTKKPLVDRVYRYLNDHQEVGVKRCVREFGGEAERVVRAYHARWKQYIKPLKWLYEFMNRKWVPNKQITLSDKKHLRGIEAMIEGESENESI